MKFLAAATFIALATSAATAAVDGSVKDAIVRGYLLRCAAAMNPAQENRDAADALLGPAFEGTDAAGLPVARDEFINQFAQVVSKVHTTTCYNTVRSLTSPDATTAVAVNVFHLEGLLRSSVGDHHALLNEISQDTWTVANGKWTISQSKTLKILITIDGKVIREEGR